MSHPGPLAALHAGDSVSDEEFDRLLPTWARNVSGLHFTPVRVARRAAELLVARAGARVLDVGAGVGKLCIVGALTTQGSFVGVEQRGHLVAAGRALLRRGQVLRGPDARRLAGARERAPRHRPAGALGQGRARLSRASALDILPGGLTLG
jgi:hypothetical protein